MSSDSRLALFTAIAGAIAVALKKAFAPQRSPKPGYITRVEFHQGLDAMRDRITSGHLALGDKLDHSHREVLGALERQSQNFENRLDHLETTLARVDERTKR